MEPLSPAVERRIETMWAADEDRRHVREALAEYGREGYEREPERVRLAILKLSDGAVEKARSMVQAAKQDYRDVLAWAEYPEEMRATWAVRPELTDGDRARLDQLRRDDREQYEAWLRDTGA